MSMKQGEISLNTKATAVKGDRGYSINAVIYASADSDGKNTYNVFIEDGTNIGQIVTNRGLSIAALTYNRLDSNGNWIYDVTVEGGTKISEITIPKGNGIKGIAKINEDKYSKTYEFTFDDGTTYAFSIPNGRDAFEMWEDEQPDKPDGSDYTLEEFFEAYRGYSIDSISYKETLANGNVVYNVLIDDPTNKIIGTIETPKGDRGENLKIDVTSSTEPTSPTPNLLWLNEADGHLYIFSSESNTWVDLGKIALNTDEWSEGNDGLIYVHGNGTYANIPETLQGPPDQNGYTAKVKTNVGGNSFAYIGFEVSNGTDTVTFNINPNSSNWLTKVFNIIGTQANVNINNWVSNNSSAYLITTPLYRVSNNNGSAILVNNTTIKFDNVDKIDFSNIDVINFPLNISVAEWQEGTDGVLKTNTNGEVVNIPKVLKSLPAQNGNSATMTTNNSDDGESAIYLDADFIELSNGEVLKTPTSDLEIANKKYVDEKTKYGEFTISNWFGSNTIFRKLGNIVWVICHAEPTTQLIGEGTILWAFPQGYRPAAHFDTNCIMDNTPIGGGVARGLGILRIDISQNVLVVHPPNAFLFYEGSYFSFSFCYFTRD